MRKNFVIPIVIGVLLCLVTCVVLLFVGSNRGAEWLPAWSSNQQHIAFECMFSQSSDWLDEEYSFFNKGDICVFNRGNNELTRLTTERSMSAPTWSPNGIHLAWLQGNDTIMIWDSSTSQFEIMQYSRPFHGSEADDGGPEWSQDGRRIFVQGDGAILDVQKMTFSDPLEGQRNLDNCCFNWSPDGSYLTYKRIIREISNDWQLVIMKNNQPIYINEPKAFLFGPTQWSPDGSILAWVGFDTKHHTRITISTSSYKRRNWRDKGSDFREWVCGYQWNRLVAKRRTNRDQAG